QQARLLTSLQLSISVLRITLMMKKIILAAALSLLSSGAYAACTNPLPITANAGAVNMSVSQNTADGGCQYNVTPMQGGGPLSATNGWWTNILQGNAVISATNPLFVSPGTGATWAATQSGTWSVRNV